MASKKQKAAGRAKFIRWCFASGHCSKTKGGKVKMDKKGFAKEVKSTSVGGGKISDKKRRDILRSSKNKIGRIKEDRNEWDVWIKDDKASLKKLNTDLKKTNDRIKKYGKIEKVGKDPNWLLDRNNGALAKSLKRDISKKKKEIRSIQKEVDAFNRKIAKANKSIEKYSITPKVKQGNLFGF